MIGAWSLTAFRYAPDVVIVGTDPILSVLVAIPWKLLRPKTRIAHWCFDLYPEAAIADGTLAGNGFLSRVLRWLLGPAYRSCDLLIDLGPCMREKLLAYRSSARAITITPWALGEPPCYLECDENGREEVFGHTSLALMYSGNFGRAHAYEPILRLARSLRGAPVRFAFSVRGNRVNELKNSVTADDANIRFVPFADERNLAARLGAADIHVVTLREEWTGTVVPSKFFGALAAGRPVLFIGSSRSSIAIWIRTYGVGWVLDGNAEEVRRNLLALSRSPESLQRLFAHCHSIYSTCFSQSKGIDTFERQLEIILPEGKPGRRPQPGQQLSDAPDATFEATAGRV